MPAFLEPTNAPFGSQILTIGVTAYVAENISFNQPTTVAERRDEDGDPSGQAIVAGFDNGSASLQYATTLTLAPAIGATFTLTRNGGATIGCVVSEAGDAFTQMDFKKGTISFRRRYAS